MKCSKKDSDEDKIVRKKKSKSNKRRRRGSPSSSSSYSSEPEDDPRAQRRQRQRKKGSTKSEKQRKESKKSGRKKPRRSSRHRRRISASPSSDRSCSACSRSSSSGGSADGRRRHRRSRSPAARPDRKRKSRARSGSRGRSRRRMNDERDGRRLRSRSCSACQSRSGSSNSRGRSPAGGRKRTKQRDMDSEKSKRFLSQEMVPRNDSDKNDEKDENIQACGNSAGSRSKDDAYQVQRKLDAHPRSPRMKSSQRVVRKDECTHEEEGELVPEKAYNQPSEKANAGEDDFTEKNENPSNSVSPVADLELILRQKALENFRKFRSGASTNRAAIASPGNQASEIRDDPSEVVELRQKASENLRKCQDGISANRRTHPDMENDATEAHEDPPEVIEMRQKALENFRKSQGGISVNSRPAVNGDNGSDQTLSYDKPPGSVDVQNSENLVRHRLTTYHEQQVRIHGDNRQSGRRMRSIVTIPERGIVKPNISSQNSCNISKVANMYLPDNSNESQIIRSPVDADKPSTEAPSLGTSLEEDKQHKQIDAETNNITEADVQMVAGISAPESDSRLEIKEENAGSQFQEKKFSRMHDGELVQVSYKVYIPNRAPALARRKLRR